MFQKKRLETWLRIPGYLTTSKKNLNPWRCFVILWKTDLWLQLKMQLNQPFAPKFRLASKRHKKDLEFLALSRNNQVVSLGAHVASYLISWSSSLGAVECWFNWSINEKVKSNKPKIFTESFPIKSTQSMSVSTSTAANSDNTEDELFFPSSTILNK